MATSPSIVVIGGPNGAGKTTTSRAAISEIMGVAEFVNADIIAQGLSGFDPGRAALQAGRIMLTRLRELAALRANFAFETTLASRTFAPWLAELVPTGYQFHLVFVWLRSPELAIRRVHARVRHGGHSVPDDVVRRRYARGIANLVNLYIPIATRWRVYDNSSTSGPSAVASGGNDRPLTITDPRAWNAILEVADAQGTQDDH
jgi:predicted ABC-type ATPase